MLNVVVVVSHLFRFVHFFSVFFSIVCTSFPFCALQLQFPGRRDDRRADRSGVGLTLDEPVMLSVEFSKNAWAEFYFAVWEARARDGEPERVGEQCRPGEGRG
jgi:hypothetical protein